MKSIARCSSLKTFFILISLFIFSLPIIANAGDLVVIVNKDNGVSSLALKDLAKLYKGKTKQWSGGEEVILFLPDAKSKAMLGLAKNVFKRKNGLAVSKFYLKAVFQQKFASPPQKVANAEEAISAVADEAGGIAIVDVGEISDKSAIKIIQVDGL